VINSSLLILLIHGPHPRVSKSLVSSSLHTSSNYRHRNKGSFHECLNDVPADEFVSFLQAVSLVGSNSRLLGGPCVALEHLPLYNYQSNLELKQPGILNGIPWYSKCTSMNPCDKTACNNYIIMHIMPFQPWHVSGANVLFNGSQLMVWAKHCFVYGTCIRWWMTW